MGDREARNAPGALDAVRLARDVLSELDLEVVLLRVLESARALSGARYAALGGNLYLTEKAGGKEFTEEDERTIRLLAEFAGVAIDHARRYSLLDAQHTELKRTVDALDATMQIAQALGGETDLDLILGLVAKRGRALVAAGAVVIEHEQAGEMVVAAGTGELPAGLMGERVDLQDSLASAALRISQTLRLEDQPNRARFEQHGLGRLGVQADAGLVVPLIFRGRVYGC